MGLPFADVPARADDPPQVALRIGKPGSRQFVGDRFPVRGNQFRLNLVPSGFQDVLHGLSDPAAVLLPEQLEGVHVGNLVRRVPGDVDNRLIPSKRLTLRVDHVEQIGNGVEALGDKVSFVLQPAFVFLLLGDVPEEPDPAVIPAVVPPNRGRVAVHHPAVRQLDFVPGRFLGMVIQVLHALKEFLGTVDLIEPLVQNLLIVPGPHRLLGNLPEVEKSLIVIDELPVFVHDQHAVDA